MSGNYNYNHASIDPLVFKSQLTVNNEIENQATYLVLLLRQPIFTNQSLLLKLDGAYSFARIHSFVTVNPQVGGILARPLCKWIVFTTEITSPRLWPLPGECC